MDNKQQIEEILTKARESLSQFCIEECHAYCCRKGYLVLTPDEMKVTIQDKFKEYREMRWLKPMSDGNWSLYMQADHPCPSLKDNMRLIHRSPNRSDTCRIFPIHVDENKTIKISKRCPAGKTQYFFPFIKELMSLGCLLPKR